MGGRHVIHRNAVKCSKNSMPDFSFVPPALIMKGGVVVALIVVTAPLKTVSTHGQDIGR